MLFYFSNLIKCKCIINYNIFIFQGIVLNLHIICAVTPIWGFNILIYILFIMTRYSFRIYLFFPTFLANAIAYVFCFIDKHCVKLNVLGIVRYFFKISLIWMIIKDWSQKISIFLHYQTMMVSILVMIFAEYGLINNI